MLVLAALLSTYYRFLRGRRRFFRLTLRVIRIRWQRVFRSTPASCQKQQKKHRQRVKTTNAKKIVFI